MNERCFPSAGGYAPGAKENPASGAGSQKEQIGAQSINANDRQPLCASQAAKSVENWNRIPAELRALKRWAVSTGKPRKDGKAPRNPHSGKLIDPTATHELVSFEEARDSGYPMIGFVLVEGDGFTVIDLDDKPDKPATAEDRDVFRRIIERFDSYTEVSSSGRGAHVIVRGVMPEAGRRRGNVEAYSAQRYMICTGNSVGSPKPIAERQAVLDRFYREVSGGTVKAGELVDGHSFLTDAEVVDMGRRAVNNAKFRKLHDDGDLSGYPSQSEADFALLSMLAFYSNDNEQVRRLFRACPLGQREKATEDDRYLDLCLRKIRPKLGTPIDREATMKALTGGKPNRPPRTRSRGLSFTRIDRLDMEPVAFAIDGWLAQESTAAIIGASGTGKSFLAIDWSLCIASGRPWWGKAVHQGPVFYIAGEGVRGIRKRCEAWSIYHGVPLDGLPFYLAGNMPDLSSPEGAHVIIEAVNALAEEHGQSPALIVIDTLARALHGESDNDAKTMNGFGACMDILREEWSATVLAIHHTGHDNGHRARGHSGFTANLDSWYLMQSTGLGPPSQLTSGKEKDWPKPDQLSLALKQMMAGTETSCVLENMGVANAQRLLSEEEKRRGVIELRNAGKTIREIVDATGVPRSTVSRWTQAAGFGEGEP